VDLNLDTLKSEILQYLEGSKFAVFHSNPGTLDGQPLVLWDAERHPDYRMFLDVAREAGCKLVCFASREFQPEEIDDLLLQLEDSDIERDDQRQYQTQLRRLREYEGVTCTLELAFDYNSRLYVYEMQPDWFTEFLNIEDEILSHFGMAEDDEADDPGSLGGYFSKN
jgi:hypothetical protein